jgi:hypothetical protein
MNKIIKTQVRREAVWRILLEKHLRKHGTHCSPKKKNNNNNNKKNHENTGWVRSAAHTARETPAKARHPLLFKEEKKEKKKIIKKIMKTQVGCEARCVLLEKHLRESGAPGGEAPQAAQGGGGGHALGEEGQEGGQGVETAVEETAVVVSALACEVCPARLVAAL